MKIICKQTKEEVGKAAATLGAQLIQKAIEEKGTAHVIFATGSAQFEMLQHFVTLPIAWEKLIGFHLDEYIGISASHRASFRKFLKERFVDKVGPVTFHYVNGETDPDEECRRLSDLIRKHPIDVAFIGIGENSHMAFNDPPADFETTHPYIQVALDEDSRRQQVNEGWFNTLEDVPKKAISMSVQQILQSQHIIAVVPEKRKARAVQRTLQSAVSPDVPASILKTHAHTTLLLDPDSASLIEQHEYTR